MTALHRAASIRAAERRALAATPPGELMARAAEAVAESCAELLRDLPQQTPVLALVGPGNNGGDALLAAHRLRARGFDALALALSASPPAPADAARVWHAWTGTRTPGTGQPVHRPGDLDALLARAPLVIDGLFGIGLARRLDGEAAAIVARVQASGLPVVAVDVPSGLDADTGAVVGGADGTALAARLTVTMIADKPGLRTGAGAGLAGRVRVATLGVEAGPPDGRLLDARDFAALARPRERDTHKGRFGDVLVVGGAPGMRGAALLAALGAQAVGAGRVIVGFAGAMGGDGGTDPVHPELMSRRIDPDSPEPLGAATAIAVGCGLGGEPAARRLVAHALGHRAGLVLDADALNAIAADAALRERLAARAADAGGCVLTPHPLEAARLLGASVAEVQRDRIGAATTLAEMTGAVVVLKGAGTVVATAHRDWSINGSGGPILATAGTGDVLAGTIAGLLATGLAPVDAARFGAWLHGAAGDALAARDDGRHAIGMPASALPAAIRARINRPAAARS